MDDQVSKAAEDRFGGMSVRQLLEFLLTENRLLSENLSAVQDRSGDLLEYGRVCRRKIVQLGGGDPGSPSDFRRG